ncbi:hypothetical protein KC644_00220 [Candidatus Berkelbacteria bacterium]|nr:hypothetical protein [Candidatus Berkelbacteria bacterium]
MEEIICAEEEAMSHFYQNISSIPENPYDLNPELVLADALVKHKVANSLQEIPWQKIDVCTWYWINDARKNSVRWGESHDYAYPRSIWGIIVEGKPKGNALIEATGRVVILTPNCELHSCEYQRCHLSAKFETEIGTLPNWDSRQSPIGLWAKHGEQLHRLLHSLNSLK